MRVFWTQTALNDLKKIYEHFKRVANIRIARKVKQSILNRTKKLLKMPYMGMIEGTLEILEKEHRYLVEGNYKIIYRVEDEIIYITDVFDTRQDPNVLLEKYE